MVTRDLVCLVKFLFPANKIFLCKINKCINNKYIKGLNFLKLICSGFLILCTTYFEA